MQKPHLPKPAKIPRCDEFGKMLALDVFEEKNIEGDEVSCNLVGGRHHHELAWSLGETLSWRIWQVDD